MEKFQTSFIFLLASFIVINANINDQKLTSLKSICDQCNVRIHDEISDMERSEMVLLETYEELCRKIKEKQKQNKCIKELTSKVKSILNFYKETLKNHCKNTKFCDNEGDTLTHIQQSGRTSEKHHNFVIERSRNEIPFLNDLMKFHNDSSSWEACDQCKEFIKYLQSTLKDDKNNYIEVNDKFCLQIKDQKKQISCKQKGREEAQQLYDTFNSFYDPEIFCKTYYFCDQVGQQQIVNDGFQCTWCKSLIGYFNDLIKSGKSKDEVRKEMYDICDNMWVLKDKCVGFVDEYIDKIYDLIKNGMDSEQVCAELYLCSAVQYQIMNSMTSQTCVICEFVFYKFDQMLADKNVTENLKQQIRNICSEIPQTINKECQQFIDFYYNMIIMMIESTKPADMCGEMKLCSTSSH